MKGIAGNKVRTITCLGCGRSKTARMRPGTQYCTLQCYRSSARPKRRTGKLVRCAVCPTEFYVPKNRLASGKVRFCSNDCCNQWQGRNKTEHVCKICARTFFWSPSRHKVANITYCSPRCRDRDPARREMLLRMNVIQQQTSPTSLERAGYTLMKDAGIEFVAQHQIGGKFVVDAFIEACGVVVQFDGDYWHGNPKRFSKLDARQHARRTLDRSQDAYMKRCGLLVIRFWENDVHRRPDDVLRQLLHAMTLCGRKPDEPTRS